VFNQISAKYGRYASIFPAVGRPPLFRKLIVPVAGAGERADKEYLRVGLAVEQAVHVKASAPMSASSAVGGAIWPVWVMPVEISMHKKSLFVSF